VPPLDAGLLAFAVMFTLLFLGVPIGFSMSLAGLLGMGLIIGMWPAIGLFATTAYEQTVSYSLSIIPLFILMGSVASRSGLSQELYKAFDTWIGSFRGGLALATIGACGAFAAICGSSLATAATMSKVALPEMRRYHYSESLATGAVAAGGVLGILIPPSVILVLYGILTETSIGDLFIAGFIPGILSVLGFMIAIAVVTRIWPDISQPGDKSTFAAKIEALGNTWGVILLFALVIGGIYFGWFTPTEAAGVGAFGAFVISGLRGRLTLASIWDALVETITTTSMIFMVLVGAITVNNLLIFSGMASALSDFVNGLQFAPMVVMAIILLIYMLMGCVFDSLAMILLTVPIFFPIVQGLGFDPVWFGVLVVMVVELGLITPPIGMNVFVIKGMAPEVPLATIYLGVTPFVIAQILLIALMFLVPDIVLWLPQTAAQFR
jgi:tripartite ATP-independent transporter DctM subunit